jgi:hypothetical protein
METEKITDCVVNDDLENCRARLLAGDNPNEVYLGGCVWFLFICSSLMRRWSLLQAAVINQNVEMVNLLLEFGAEVNFLDKSHQTALHFAATFGYCDCMTSLHVFLLFLSFEFSFWSDSIAGGAGCIAECSK